MNIICIPRTRTEIGLLYYVYYNVVICARCNFWTFPAYKSTRIVFSIAMLQKSYLPLSHVKGLNWKIMFELWIFMLEQWYNQKRIKSTQKILEHMSESVFNHFKAINFFQHPVLSKWVNMFLSKFSFSIFKKIFEKNNV